MPDSSEKTERAVPADEIVPAGDAASSENSVPAASSCARESFGGVPAKDAAGAEKLVPAENLPRKPFVATLDMRTKILVSVMSTTCALLLNDWRMLAAVNALTFVYVLSLRRPKPVAVMYFSVALMLGAAYCCIPAFAWTLGAIGKLLPSEFGGGFVGLSRMLSAQSFETFLLPFMRISVSMNVFLALGLTFDNQEFVSVMRKLRLPRIVFIPLMVCCRFVSSFVNDLRELYESLRIRRRKMNFVSLVTSPRDVLRFIVVPVCVRTLRIADNLVLMCEVRRIGYSSRCHCVVEQAMRRRDWCILSVAVGAFCAALLAQAFFSPVPAKSVMH